MSTFAKQSFFKKYKLSSASHAGLLISLVCWFWWKWSSNVCCVYQPHSITWLNSSFCLLLQPERSHEGLARKALAAQLLPAYSLHKDTLRRKIVLLVCSGLIDKWSAQWHGRNTHLPTLSFRRLSKCAARSISFSSSVHFSQRRCCLPRVCLSVSADTETTMEGCRSSKMAEGDASGDVHSEKGTHLYNRKHQSARRVALATDTWEWLGQWPVCVCDWPTAVVLRPALIGQTRSLSSAHLQSSIKQRHFALLLSSHCPLSSS